MTGGSIRTIVRACLLRGLVIAAMAVATSRESCAEGGFFRGGDGGESSASVRDAAIASLPMQRLTRDAQTQIMSIVQSPTIYRRLPTQAIDCDRDMFLFLSRNPEVLVGMWDLMGITNVQIRRTGQYQMEAVDGSGTKCRVDLVYGDPNMHIFVASGSYDGTMVAKPIEGKGVFILTSRYSLSAEGRTTVTGTIDTFIQLENLGADLVARTLSGLIGRSADNNFIETARFIAQVSQASEQNPTKMLDIASRLPQVSETTRQEFETQITNVARTDEQRRSRVAKLP